MAFALHRLSVLALFSRATSQEKSSADGAVVEKVFGVFVIEAKVYRAISFSTKGCTSSPKCGIGSLS
jgi:hypothetical protein